MMLSATLWGSDQCCSHFRSFFISGICRPGDVVVVANILTSSSFCCSGNFNTADLDVHCCGRTMVWILPPWTQCGVRRSGLCVNAGPPHQASRARWECTNPVLHERATGLPLMYPNLEQCSPPGCSASLHHCEMVCSSKHDVPEVLLQVLCEHFGNCSFDSSKPC